MSKSRILIIQPFGLGDIIFAFPLVEAIKRNNPDASIGFICNERTEELIALNPSIEWAHEFNRDYFRQQFRQNPFKGIAYILKILKEIRNIRYEIVFDLSLGRQYAFMMMLLGIRRRIGYDYKNRGIFLNKKMAFEGYQTESVRHTVMQLLKLSSETSSPQDLEIHYPKMKTALGANQLFLDWCKTNQLNPGGPFIMIAPGGGISWGPDAEYKQWPLHGFAGFMQSWHDKYKSQFILIGDEADAALCQRLSEMAAMSKNALMINMSLVLVMEAMRNARLFVGNDGGLLHLANLMQVPVIGLYGPVDERVYGPLGDENNAMMVTADVPCRPCYQNFKFPKCNHHKQCLTQIMPEKVHQIAEKMHR